MSEIVKRMRAARCYAGLSQAELAQRLDISERTYMRIETGERPTKRSELAAIARICGLPEEWFSADLERIYEITQEGADPVQELRNEFQQAISDMTDRIEELESQLPRDSPPQDESRRPREK